MIFDDVHVPCERCFLLGDPELCNGFYIGHVAPSST